MDSGHTSLPGKFCKATKSKGAAYEVTGRIALRYDPPASAGTRRERGRLQNCTLTYVDVAILRGVAGRGQDNRFVKYDPVIAITARRFAKTIPEEGFLPES